MSAVIVRDEFRLSRHIGMVSAVGQQQEVKLWDYAQAKDGTYWFWPAEHKEPASMVHCGDTIKAGKRSEGYGGRLMQFPTKDGIIEIQGPWHANSESLFEQTGFDIRDRHLTFGLVCMIRDHDDNGDTIFRDILYIDPEEGKLGRYERINEMAQREANDLDTCVYYYNKSSGGSSNGPVYPDGWNREQQNSFHKIGK